MARRSQQRQGRRIRNLAVMVRRKRSQTHLFYFFDLHLRFQITRVQSRTTLQDPTHLQDSQFENSGLHLVKFHATHPWKFGEVPMNEAGNSRQSSAILAILRLPRSCKSASFPAATAPGSNRPISCTNIPWCTYGLFSGRLFKIFAIYCAVSKLYGLKVPTSAKNCPTICRYSPLKTQGVQIGPLLWSALWNCTTFWHPGKGLSIDPVDYKIRSHNARSPSHNMSASYEDVLREGREVERVSAIPYS